MVFVLENADVERHVELYECDVRGSEGCILYFQEWLSAYMNRNKSENDAVRLLIISKLLLKCGRFRLN